MGTMWSTRGMTLAGDAGMMEARILKHDLAHEPSVQEFARGARKTHLLRAIG